MGLVVDVFRESWELLVDAGIYVLFGILVAGILKVFLRAETVARHLGGRGVGSVLKAGLFGIPLPLCSCGVLPAATTLERNGAGRGATAAFLISTPESSVDSIAVSYALLDPILTIVRPVAAFVTATISGVLVNLFDRPDAAIRGPAPDVRCCRNGKSDGLACPSGLPTPQEPLLPRLAGGFRYAFTDLWGDIAVWFIVGMLISGVISARVPTGALGGYLGGGIGAMLVMLLAGMPMYICASASTPVAAALILKGVSPGVALVFLLAGPATNVTSMTVLIRILGKKATAIHLATIAVCTVLAGLVVDSIYSSAGISAQAVVGQAAGMLPEPLRITGAVILLAISVRPVYRRIRSLVAKKA